MHFLSVLVGLIGVTTFVVAILGKAEDAVLGITKMDALICSATLILIAIWVQIATIHHMMLEKQNGAA